MNSQLVPSRYAVPAAAEEQAGIARRLAPLIIALAALTSTAAFLPFVMKGGGGPQPHLSVRGEQVLTWGVGPYRHMPAEVAVQGLAQDAVTLLAGVPVMLLALMFALRGSRPGYLALVGAVGYLFVQYFLYLAMGTYNELFLLWVAILMLSAQALFRLLLRAPSAQFFANQTRLGRRYVGGFLLANGALIVALWLSVIVPPLMDGSLYPAGLDHLTTMVVQGFDLALFLPVSFVAGVNYWRGRPVGDLLGPVYAVFVTLQMAALLAKIAWMTAVGAAPGPALVIIPALLLGACVAAAVSLRSVRAPSPA